MSLTFRTHGIVLAQRDYREADRWYSVLTSEHGKLDLRAKGSRKISSKLASHLEPFALCDLMVVRGHYGDIVAGVERVETYPHIRLDFEKLTLAGQAFQLVDIGTRPREHDPVLFAELRTWLQCLNGSPELPRERSAFLLAAFTLKLLALLGYRPELLRCVGCRSAIAPMAYAWHGLRGGVVCRSCTARSPEQWFAARGIQDNTLKLVRYAMSEHFETLLDVRLPGPLLPEFHDVVESLVIAHFPVIPTMTLRQAVAV